MNQILISEKLYVTPELKKKKKVFRFEFFLSVFLLCILSSYAIYAEYDRNKSEQVSREILEGISYNNVQQQEKEEQEDDVIIVVLNKALEDNEDTEEETTPPPEVPVTEEQQALKTEDGSEYYVIGEINIPSINVNYPILNSDTLDNIDALLKISVCKFHGAKPNTVGNLCIVGHNYKNSKFFSKVPTLENGDIIEIKDLSGRTLKYAVYNKFIVDPDNVACTSQLTGGKKEITLITCTDDNKQRYIIKAREVI